MPTIGAILINIFLSTYFMPLKMEIREHIAYNLGPNFLTIRDKLHEVLAMLVSYMNFFKLPINISDL